MPKLKRRHIKAVTVKAPERGKVDVFKEERCRAAMITRYRDMAVLRQNYQCHYCLDGITHKTATADHMVPLCEGGEHSDANIVASCKPCNLAKGAMAYRQFLAIIWGESMPSLFTGPKLCTAWIRRFMNERIARAERRIRFAAGMAA